MFWFSNPPTADLAYLENKNNCFLMNYIYNIPADIKFPAEKNRAVLVFATERKNNVDPRLRSQKKVKNVQLFFAKLQLGHSDLVLKNWLKDILNSHMQPQCSNKLT